MTDTLVENRAEAAAKSVTRDNAFPIDRGGGYFQILIPSNTSNWGTLPAFLPNDFRERERVLDSTVRADAMWSAAIGIAITKAAALAWETKSESALRSKRAQELLLAADATSISGIGGWVSYMGKQVRNFTCTNGGCFTEIIRATGAYGSKIVGLGHLSSLRMRRTGDPEYPFIYLDRWGRQHVMRWWQVFNLVDMPDPDESSLGMGLCAAERAYPQIRKSSALELYLYEKISGSRPLALHIVNGLTKDQLMDMMASASDSQAAKGLSMYMGAIVATTLKPDAAPSLVTIPLAELPDGFEAAAERDRSDLIYANALGLDPQDLKPMSNQQMGAGAQSEVLNQKAEGRGQAAYRQQLTHMLNQLVFDDKTQFLFTEHDYRDQKAAADVSTARGAFISGLVEKQLISAQQGLQVLIEQGELPKAFIEQGAQAGSDLSDTDKPDVQESLNDASGPPQPTNVPVMQAQTPAPTTPAPTAATPVEAKEVGAEPVPTRVNRTHHVGARHIQRGARRILRELHGRGAIRAKGWVTINGHPVLIGGAGGGGGGGGGGAGADKGSSGGGGSGGAVTDQKKPHKTYVPKAAGGGDSKYPTLDGYKKGTISHENALVMLKQDIKDAKLAGDTKAVNSLTSHYYAIKNGPKKAIAAIEPDPTFSKQAVAQSAHKVTEAFVNDKISGAEMDKQLTALGKKTGHTPDQLKQMAKEHEEGIHNAKLQKQAMADEDNHIHAANLAKSLASGEITLATYQGELKALSASSGIPMHKLGKSTPLADSFPTPLPDSPSAPAPKISKEHKESVIALGQQYDVGLVSQTSYDKGMADIAKAEGIHVNDLEKHLKPGVDVTPAHAVEAHTIMMKVVKGDISASTMALQMEDLSAKTGIPKADLIAAGKAHNAALNVAEGKPATSSKIAAVAGTPAHDLVESSNIKIKNGEATQEDIDHIKKSIDASINLETNKLNSAKAAIDSAKVAGIAPLPSVVAMHDKAEASIAGYKALSTNVDTSVALYGLKKDVGGISAQHQVTANNFTNLYDKGVISPEAYDKQMTLLAAKAGVPKQQLLDATANIKAGNPVGTPIHSVVATPVNISGGVPAHYQQAVALNEQFNKGQISNVKYQTEMQALADANGIATVQKLKVQAQNHMTALQPHLDKGEQVLKDYGDQKISPSEYMQKMTALGKEAGMSGPDFVSSVKKATEGKLGAMTVIDIDGKPFKVTSHRQDADDWGAVQWEGKTVTDAQKRAMYDYSYQGDQAINQKLRFGKDLDFTNLRPAQQPARRDANIKELDGLMAASSVPTNVQVKRGFSNPALIDRMSQGLPLEGAIFRDDAFVSTAVSHASAFREPIRTKINVPQGSQGIYMAPYVRDQYQGETELLLPRGSNFRVRGYQKITNAHEEFYELELDYLGAGDIPGAFKEYNLGS